MRRIGQIAVAAALAFMPVSTTRGQEPPPDTAEEPALSDEIVLDDLVAPVALYPDALLAQVLVAATCPLELVKADRWVTENDELAEDVRVDAADAEGWDSSVAVLAASFPDLVQRMASDLDHTGSQGNAVLAQTDDVMDAVQRQRARAAKLGNLGSSEAQTVTVTVTVTVEGDSIAIAPANPEVIHLPACDPNHACTQAVSSAPVVVTQPDDDSYSSGDLQATRAIAYRAACGSGVGAAVKRRSRQPARCLSIVASVMPCPRRRAQKRRRTPSTNALAPPSSPNSP